VAILQDITKDILQWQDEGDQIILLTDFNDDITLQQARQWVGKLGLVEAVTWLNTNDAPPTFQRGSRPIDGIFAAPQLLERAAGGYLAFGEAVPSDHRAIWVDFVLPQVCPRRQEAYSQPKARRLQCKDPRVVDKYNNVLHEKLVKLNIPFRLQTINDIVKNWLISSADTATN